MADQHVSRCQGILSLDRAHLREIGGVVFDEDSYRRYAQHQLPTPAAAPATPEPHPADKPSEPAPEASAPAEPRAQAVPAPVFAVDPVHAGWYTTETNAVYPIMAGAIRAGQLVLPAGGSGSGSFTTSYLTSLSTSYTLSFSGSFWSSFRSSGSGSCAFGPGGYGLDLI